MECNFVYGSRRTKQCKMLAARNILHTKKRPTIQHRPKPAHPLTLHDKSSSMAFVRFGLYSFWLAWENDAGNEGKCEPEAVNARATWMDITL